MSAAIDSDSDVEGEGEGVRWTGLLDDGDGRVVDPAGIERCSRALAVELAGRLGTRRATADGAADDAALGLLADNGVPWALLDLAALESRLTLVPLPGFFTDAQLRHVAATAGLCGVVTDQPARVRAALHSSLAGAETELSCGLVYVPLGHRERQAPAPGRAAKITFTSGTTGAPKGVRLAARSLLDVARSLAVASEIGPGDVHLATLPLSVLLENVGGLYRGLAAGARVVVPPLARVGLSGSSAQCGETLVDGLESSGATTAILVPQTLTLLVEQLERGRRLPRLRFLGVGGAPVAAPLLARSARLGLPVFEGYGLSEAGSVLTLNTRRARKAGSVGRPLPHVTLRIADDGEVLARGASLLGYVGELRSPLRDDGWLATGDLGALDADGFLTLTGRKRSVLRTAYGRKLSPEWVERELLAEPAIAAAAVFGDGLPQLWAVLVPAGAAASATAGASAGLQAAVGAANGRLPDYARVGRWVLAREPFSQANGQLNVAGRLRREAIEAAYSPLSTPTASP